MTAISPTYLELQSAKDNIQIIINDDDIFRSDFYKIQRLYGGSRQRDS